MEEIMIIVLQAIVLGSAVLTLAYWVPYFAALGWYKGRSEVKCVKYVYKTYEFKSFNVKQKGNETGNENALHEKSK